MEAAQHEFDYIAKRIWFGEPDAARLVAGMTTRDRHALEQCLLSLYGVFIDLTGDEADIMAARERARRR
jgi:hypothetical protein